MLLLRLLLSSNAPVIPCRQHWKGVSVSEVNLGWHTLFRKQALFWAFYNIILRIIRYFVAPEILKTKTININIKALDKEACFIA